MSKWYVSEGGKYVFWKCKCGYSWTNRQKECVSCKDKMPPFKEVSTFSTLSYSEECGCMACERIREKAVVKDKNSKKADRMKNLVWKLFKVAVISVSAITLWEKGSAIPEMQWWTAWGTGFFCPSCDLLLTDKAHDLPLSCWECGSPASNLHARQRAYRNKRTLLFPSPLAVVGREFKSQERFVTSEEDKKRGEF